MTPPRPRPAAKPLPTTRHGRPPGGTSSVPAGGVDLTDPRWRERGSCYGHPDPNLWFPEKTAGGSNHGTVAKAICAGCPVRETCLVDAMLENEQWAVTGGAGGGVRRWLRRAWVVDGLEGGPVWSAAVAQHWAQLDGVLDRVPDRNGPGASHGLPVTYARGCRCGACGLAVSLRGAMSSLRPRPSRARDSTRVAA